MTLNATLRQKLAEWRPAGENDVLTVTEAGWTAEVKTERCESLGCLVRELRLRSATTDTAAPALKDWADRVAVRVTGLLEPLRLLEVDDVRRTAVLRSNEPARSDDEVSYYELLLEGGGSANLRRYRAARQPGARREAVGFALTHDALAKVADDVAASR